MANTQEKVAAEALLMLQNSKPETPKPKWTFVVPVLKNTSPQVPVPAEAAGPSNPIKRKRAYRAPSTPNKRTEKGRFAKKESLFVPKPARKAFTGIISNI